MLYVRKLFTQDLRDGKQIAFPKEPSLSFFSFDYLNNEKYRKITFTFRANFDEFEKYEGKQITTRLYAAGSESRMDGEVKAFIRDILHANVDDLLILKNKGTKHTDYEFMFVPKSNPMYASLLSLTYGDNHSVYSIEEEQVETHEFPLQQIYYGAPGTGKSHGIKSQESKFAEVIRTTFHPDSDYSTFVGAYKPTMKRTKKCVIIDKEEREITPAVTHDEYEERITYTFVKQAFLKAYIAAWKSLKEGKKILLVIEEINRGNCAQIFGDLFQLLDREESGYSSYPISADEDLHQVLEREFLEVDDMPATVKSGEELLLPPNLYIWATMNTSDQSLFPIDSAFKRRWDWKYVPISKKDTNYQIEVRKEIDVDGEMVKKTFRYDWWDFLDRVNTAIAKATSSEDKKLGYFLCKASKRIADTDKEPSIITADKFVGKVVFYLWNDVFKDFEIGDAKFRYGEDDLSLLSTKVGEDEVKREFSSFFDEEGNAKHEAVAKLLDDLKVEGKEVEDGGSEAKSEAAAGGFQE